MLLTALGLSSTTYNQMLDARPHMYSQTNSSELKE